MTQKFTALPPTRAGTHAALASAGVGGAAAEAFLDASARDRHAYRTRRFIAAALDEWRRVNGRAPGSPIPAEELASGRAQAYAIAALVLEAFGVVDDAGPSESASRIRHRAFREGCGPRVGPMAGATHAASRAALEDLWRGGGGEGQRPAITVFPIDPGMPGIVIDAPPLPGVTLYVNPVGLLAQSPGWLSTIALEGMRRAAGMEPWFRLAGERQPAAGERSASPHVLDLVQVFGDMQTWGAVLSAAKERARVDELDRGVRRISALTSPDEPLFHWPPYERPAGQRAALEQILAWVRAALPEHVEATVRDERASLGIMSIEAEGARMFQRLQLERAAVDVELGGPGQEDDSAGRDALVALRLFGIAAATTARRGWDASSVTCAARMAAWTLTARHKVVALSPEPVLSMLLGEAGAVVADVRSPAATSRSTGLPGYVDLARCASAAVAPGGARQLFGVQVIGTAAEWTAVAEQLAQGQP